MKRFLLLSLIALSVAISAIAGINEKLSASTQLFMAERDGKISLDITLPGPKMMSRAPLLRTPAVDRYIAPAERVNGVDMVSAFIHINPNFTSKIEGMGVVVQERFRDFVVAMIPVDKIERIAEVADVKQINVARKMRLRTDRARYYTNTDDVLNYSNDAITAGLPQAFKGTGVVVGVIDDGIDFQHTMFKDASGNSRIKRAYVAKSSSSFTTYTSVTSSSPTTDDTGESHGTHTSSTAGGSDITYSGTTYGGMAPESSLVLVGCGQYLYNTNIAMGIKYIFDYADSQNMPAVCSISLGSHFGPHDGTGELASVYSQYAGSNPNHIIVYAAGNEAGGDYGTVYSGTSSTSSTSPFTTVINGLYYIYQGYGSSYLNRMYVGYDVFYARTANKALACKLHVVNTSSRSVVWSSSAITSSTSSVSGITTYFSSSPSVTITRDSYSGKYYVQLYYTSSGITKKSSYNSSNYALAISVYPTSGSCGIDGWDVNGNNAFGSMSGSIGGYTFVAGSDDASVGDEACSDDVISVGAYASKTSVKDYKNSTHSLTAYYTLNDIAYFSSYQASGCGATGVAKPDICAPGATIVAGVNHYDTQGMMANALADYGYYLVSNNTNSSLGSMDGTSMATPCAAGIIALYLQAAKYAGKTLNTNGIRDVFANSAITDNYTSKKNFGPYGKINALEGIRYILGSTPLPTPELTVNPTSLSFTTNTGSTVTKTFTVTGTDLTGNVNVAVSGNYYSVSPTTITAAQAAAGATVTVTYKPTAAGTHTGTVTLSTAGGTNKTVSLTGTATSVPSLTAMPTSLSMSTTVGTPVTQTFTVTGANLTSNVVYLSCSGAGFTIDKTNISKSAATNGSTITVTYNPTAAGTHTGTVTITSNGAEAVTVSLNGTAVGVPTITANPTSLNFNATVGESVTKTFTVTGTDLTGNIALAVSGTGFSIDKTSITRTAATNGATVTVTYRPTAGGTHTGTVTLTSNGAQAATVSLNGTATANPTLTADPTTLNMVTTVGTPVTQTFTVTGANLTGNVTLAVNGTGFTIDKTSITRSAATSGSTVTVTYNPAAFGTHTGTVTISSNGAEAVTVTLNGQANLVKYAPVMLTADEDAITLTSFRADWTDSTPDANISSYTLEVSSKPEVAHDPVLIGSLSGTEFSGSATYYSITLSAPWSGVNTRGGLNSINYFRNNYQGDGVNGNITYTVPKGYENATFTVKVTTGSSSDGSGNITVSTPQTAALGHSFTSGETYSWLVTASSGELITFTSTDDNYSPDIALIEIYSGNAITTNLKASESGDALYRLITGITDKFYTVENLAAAGTFLYKVKALYQDGTESEWSNIEEVTLFESGHGYQLGDVNHDGSVSIKDVTTLIDGLLGNMSGVCEICADVSGDGTVSIKDVTSLVDMLLSNEQTVLMKMKMGR